jgi:hypothetical protein
VIYSCRLFDLWHCDPATDGSDDSCGWFMRARHGSKEVLAEIEERFAYQWSNGVPAGWFDKDGDPNYSTLSIALGMFRIAVSETFGHRSRRAERFMRRHLHEILRFGENNFDSLHSTICQPYGKDRDEKDRIHTAASVVYGWILRADRPWWRQPRWHVHHWKLQIHALQSLKRWLFSRCAKCGGRFPWGYAPVSGSWDSDGPRWFRGEPGVFHHECHGSVVAADVRVNGT